MLDIQPHEKNKVGVGVLLCFGEALPYLLCVCVWPGGGGGGANLLGFLLSLLVSSKPLMVL